MPPPPRPSSRHHIWSDLPPVDMNTQWKEDWQSALATNHAVVVDPTHQPGFPCCSWSLLNCFRTGQGPYKASLYQWGLTQSPNCSYEPQNMSHIVDSCLKTKFEGGLTVLHDADYSTRMYKTDHSIPPNTE